MGTLQEKRRSGARGGRRHAHHLGFRHSKCALLSVRHQSQGVEKAIRDRSLASKKKVQVVTN